MSGPTAENGLIKMGQQNIKDFKTIFKASFIMVSLLYYQVQNADYDLVTCASIFTESRKSDCLDRTFSWFFTISTILGSGTILVKLMDMFPV
jgi:hypothetical protein